MMKNNVTAVIDEKARFRQRVIKAHDIILSFAWMLF